MKFFEEPKVEMQIFTVEDVITASGDTETTDCGEWV